jgi:hypothetical protein
MRVGARCQHDWSAPENRYQYPEARGVNIATGMRTGGQSLRTGR